MVHGKFLETVAVTGIFGLQDFDFLVAGFFNITLFAEKGDSHD